MQNLHFNYNLPVCIILYLMFIILCKNKFSQIVDNYFVCHKFLHAISNFYIGVLFALNSLPSANCTDFSDSDMSSRTWHCPKPFMIVVEVEKCCMVLIFWVLMRKLLEVPLFRAKRRWNLYLRGCQFYLPGSHADPKGSIL